MVADRPPVLILSGGRGTRLREKTETLPKPLVEVGGKPLIWHVIQIYARQGFSDFFLLTGYLGEQIEDFVSRESWPDEVTIACLDTGLDTPTGGRLAKAASKVQGTFCATYADGVADLELSALLDFHRAGNRVATMTAVRPDLQWGVAEIDDQDEVTGFVEKPRSEQWINGGFFCFEPAVFDWLKADSVLERDPLEGLAAAGQLGAFRHEGFWDCCDTYKDLVTLNDLWAGGNAPWTVSRAPA
ncbi:MAG: NTP transferase domain-containing protein [Solirubrobacterales bacterium]|nr:NTP transferase domain-containing protein [Solirubrobacterales bacterium]